MIKTSVSITSPTGFFFPLGVFSPCLSPLCAVTPQVTLSCHEWYFLRRKMCRVEGGRGMPESSSSCFTVAAGWRWGQLGECSLSPPAWPNALWQVMGCPCLPPAPAKLQESEAAAAAADTRGPAARVVCSPLQGILSILGMQHALMSTEAFFCRSRAGSTSSHPSGTLLCSAIGLCHLNPLKSRG